MQKKWGLFRIVGGAHQRRLLKHLLDENQHNPLERPVYNDSHSLTVTMNLALQQIIDFVSVIITQIYKFLDFRMRKMKFLLLVVG
jgi:hypothetical protein